MTRDEGNPRYQTRLAPETARRVDEYQERRGTSQAQVVRELIQAGLDAEAVEQGQVRVVLQNAVAMLSVAGLVSFVAALTGTPPFTPGRWLSYVLASLVALVLVAPLLATHLPERADTYLGRFVRWVRDNLT